MTDNALTLPSPNALFLPAAGDPNARSSCKRFVTWMDTRRVHWTQADLSDYRDYLLHESGLSVASAKKHMERVRSRYRQLLNSNAVRDMIQAHIPPGASIADTYAATEEFLTRIRNNVDYGDNVAIKGTKRTVRLDSEFNWLTVDEIDAIFHVIPSTRDGLRDAAIFGLACSFGLREAEVCAVTVEDLYETVQGRNGVNVAHGKGDKQRFVFFDAVTNWLVPVYNWIQHEGITSGRVININRRQLQNRVKMYTHARPHDLRRSYARILYDNGRTVEYIRQQLGHEDTKTTLIYLGLITS